MVLLRDDTFLYQDLCSQYHYIMTFLRTKREQIFSLKYFYLLITFSNPYMVCKLHTIWSSFKNCWYKRACAAFWFSDENYKDSRSLLVNPRQTGLKTKPEVLIKFGIFVLAHHIFVIYVCSCVYSLGVTSSSRSAATIEGRMPGIPWMLHTGSHLCLWTQMSPVSEWKNTGSQHSALSE